ncbi:MAG: hypothetical protein ACXABV_16845, partial [Candidatus Thorarchaeota archaeon]
NLFDLLNDEGYLIVTVPYHYPYHEDPVDFLFRPRVEELWIMVTSRLEQLGQIHTLAMDTVVSKKWHLRDRLHILKEWHSFDVLFRKWKTSCIAVRRG